MKKTFRLKILSFALLATLSGCLESDDFDGLTDSRPPIAIEFPDREFDQEVGLGYIATGFSSNPNITYKLQLTGGDTDIRRIVSVEGRAANVELGTCPSFSLIEEDISVNGANPFDYTRDYSFFRGSSALCSPNLDVPDVYYELIFTIELSNGEQIVSQRVRGIFKE